MSSEVGTGHISVFPVLTGFKERVKKGVKDAGAAGARVFDNSFKGAGAATGKALGRDLKSALSTSAKDLGSEAMSGLKQEVAAASAALSKARLKQQDDAGRVRVAETRLQEAVERSGAGSASAVAASERLASVRRAQQLSTDAVASATKRLQDAQDALSSVTARVTVLSDASAGSLLQMTRNLRDGWVNADAARSSFTGLTGSVGGLLRAVSDVSGLSFLGRMARNVAAQVSAAFTSIATMIGGGLARALTATRSWVGSVAGVVRGAISPFTQYASAVGTLLASPFIRLGRGVASWLSPVTTQVAGVFRKIGQGISSTVGPAFGQIVASVRSIAGPLGSAAASAFQTVVSAASRAGAAAGHALGSAIRSTATAGVTVAAAGIGVALTAGLSRLTAIDTARAKLIGLGNDGAAVGSIMKDALASVKGTAFGLGEAATVAAGAVAAGIKPGEGLQRVLKTVANNAAVAGTSMQEMGTIFNRAATQVNGVQNDVIGQLQDRGIPIYQALADQMGITAGEVFKLASEGGVSFEQFAAAAEKAAGSVADEIGKTVPGALKNLRASLGRIGAGVFGGINTETGELYGLYARFGPLIASISNALKPVEAAAASLGGVLDGVLGPALDRITGFLNRIGEGASLVQLGLGSLAPIIAPLGAALAALGAGGLGGLLARIPLLTSLLPGLTGALGLLGGPLGVVAAAFAGFTLSGGDAAGLVAGLTGIINQVVAALPGLVTQVATVVPQLVTAILSQAPLLLTAAAQIVVALGQGVATALPTIATGAATLLTGLIAAIDASLPLIVQGAVQLVSALAQGLMTALPLLAKGAVSLVQGLLTGIVSALPTIIAGAGRLIEALLLGIVSALPVLATAAVDLVSGLLTGIVAALPLIIAGGVKLLLSLALGIVSALPVLLQAALDLVLGLAMALLQNLPLIIEAGIQLLLSLATGLIEALPQLITAAINLVLQLVIGLLTMLPRLIEAGVQLVVSLIKGLAEAIPKIIAMLPQIVKAIWDGLAGVNWLDLGVQIVQGIINGLLSAGGALIDAIVELASGAFQGFKDFFGIASPSKLMRRESKWVVAGAVEGVEDDAPKFADALVGMATAASSRAQAAMSTVAASVVPSVAAGGADASVSGAPVVNQYITPVQTDPRLQMRQWQREAERAFDAS